MKLRNVRHRQWNRFLDKNYNATKQQYEGQGARRHFDKWFWRKYDRKMYLRKIGRL